MKIQFFGDVSLDGLYCSPPQYYKLAENIAWIDDYLDESDLRVVNWESPLWGGEGGNPKKQKLNYPMLSTTTESSSSILPLKIDLALLANNHIYDSGEQGYKNTINFFEKNAISYIGAGSQGKSNKPFFYEKEGVSICILNYVSDDTNPMPPDSSNVKLNSLNQSTVIDDINRYKEKVDHIIIYLHWGKDELTRIPDVSQRNLARLLVDTGASLIVGSHVHCLQGWEEYNDGFIAYSLGNFIFGSLLCMPTRYDFLPEGDSHKIGVLGVSLNKSEISIKWNYFIKEKRSFILEEDSNGIVKQYHSGLNKALKLSDKKLAKKYKLEVILSIIRSYIEKNGGGVRSLFSLEIKHFSLITRIFKKL